MSTGSGALSGLRIESFSHPTVEMPYYHVRCRLTTSEPITINGASSGIAGVEKQPAVFRLEGEGGAKSKGLIPDAGEAQVLIRCDWQPGKDYEVQLDHKLPAKDAPVESITAAAKSPASGGYWNADWGNYRPFIVSETQGIDRTLEPVDASISFWLQDVTDLSKELRLVEVDPETGKQTEIPSQPYAIRHFESSEERRPIPPSARCNIAFLATVPAHGKKVYLAFHKNPNASAPNYDTDLQVTGQGEAATWENSLVGYRFMKGNGQLAEVTLKMGLDKTLRHGRGGGSAMHWNPDCWAPQRPWSYTHNWKIPVTKQMTEIRGPVFLQTTRWGSLEPRLPEVNGWVTYRLYAHNPELHMSSLMEVVEDVNILAIRNDEVVQDAALVTHYAFKERNGEVKSGAIGYSASAPDFWMGPMDLDLPWVCLYSPEGGHGLASVRLRHDFGHRYGKPATSDKAGTYLNCSQGSISYWFRAYAIELQVQRPLFLEKGAFYSETNAYLPCKMNAEKDSLVRLDERAEALRHPLSASSEVDI